MRRFRGLTIFTILVAAVMLWILWLPFPAPLQTPLLGTPTLLDIRGREIAELSSPEARVQIPDPTERNGRLAATRHRGP